MKVNVLFVCLGNICRSPMAEAIFKTMVLRAGLKAHFYIDSSGTSSFHVGQLPDKRTLSTCKSHAVPVEHLGRQFKTADFEKFDHIVVMDEANKRDVLRLAEPEHIGKVRLFGEHRGEEVIVPDPYYGGMDDFESVFQLLARESADFLEYLKEQHQLPQ